MLINKLVKSLVKITDEDVEYDMRYNIVKFLYLEKVNADGPDIVRNFEFTPGDKFMEIPIYDMVTALLDVREKTRNEEYACISEPPTTGREKSSLKLK